MRIDGLAAIVTGGASGLGAATARALAARGAKVSLFDLDETRGEEVAKEIGAVHHRVDITSESEVEAAFAASEAVHGAARILVQCAGVAPAFKLVSREGAPQPIDRFRKSIEINLIGAVITMSRFVACLRTSDTIDDERGVIINTASIAAFDGQIGQTAYAAAKAAVAGLTLPAARELAANQIRVVTIAPGVFWTPMLAGLPEAAQHSLNQATLHPSRLGRPEEYAQLVEAIILNPMLNGDTIRLDGAVRMAAK